MNIIKRKGINLQNSSFENGKIPFIVAGQGVFLFSSKGQTGSSFRILNKEENDGLEICFLPNQLLVNRIGILEPLLDKANSSGLIDTNGAYYWFSMDSQNQRLYGGIGEARIETQIYTYQFEQIKTNKTFLESLDHITFKKEISPLRLLRDPITKSIPLIVKTINEVSMNAIANSLYMHKANLSSTSQKLLECISGERFILNDDDFPDFSKAIEHSIANPDGWCYKTLLKKSTEFSKDKPNIEETYIRITLGENNGDSPGIPYVMEIWPPKHFSPIHNHAGAEAIIKVLHGQINVSLFPFLGCDKPFGTVGFEKDEITWISPTLNQTHQLHNVNTDTTCVTIQCYMYDGEDVSHYDYFDYIDPNGVVQQYEPDSDMDFIQFKQQMKDEYFNSSTRTKEPKRAEVNQINLKIDVEQTKSSLFCCFSS